MKKEAVPIYTKTVKDVVALLEPMYISYHSVIRALESGDRLFEVKIDAVRAYKGAPWRISYLSYNQLKMKLWRKTA